MIQRERTKGERGRDTAIEETYKGKKAGEIEEENRAYREKG